MSKDLQLLGFYIEDSRAGPKIVLVQSYVSPDGSAKEIEHEASDASELWNAFVAIIEDPGAGADSEPAPPMDIGEGYSNDPLVDAGLEEAQLLLERNAGPVVGRLAGAILRNPHQAKAGFERVAKYVRSISRGKRSPRMRRER